MFGMSQLKRLQDGNRRWVPTEWGMNAKGKMIMHGAVGVVGRELSIGFPRMVAEVRNPL